MSQGRFTLLQRGLPGHHLGHYPHQHVANFISVEPHKENFVERLFDHHHHGHHGQDGKSGEQSQSGGQSQQQQGGSQQPEHKESEMNKFRDYIKEDEKIEQEGGTYGGLM